LDSNFLAPCTGHREPREGPPCDLFCGVDLKRKSAHQNDWNDKYELQ
jgi:hypothetical protein